MMNIQVPLKEVKHYDLQSFISKCELGFFAKHLKNINKTKQKITFKKVYNTACLVYILFFEFLIDYS